MSIVREVSRGVVRGIERPIVGGASSPSRALGPDMWGPSTKNVTGGQTTWDSANGIAHIVTDGAYTVVQGFGTFLGATGVPWIITGEVFDYVSGQLIVGDTVDWDYIVPDGNGVFEFEWSPDSTTAQLRGRLECDFKVRNIKVMRVLT